MLVAVVLLAVDDDDIDGDDIDDDDIDDVEVDDEDDEDGESVEEGNGVRVRETSSDDAVSVTESSPLDGRIGNCCSRDGINEEEEEEEEEPSVGWTEMGPIRPPPLPPL